eukprot:768473-Hanusia_phi.AAC.1
MIFSSLSISVGPGRYVKPRPPAVPVTRSSEVPGSGAVRPGPAAGRAGAPAAGAQLPGKFSFFRPAPSGFLCESYRGPCG